MRDFDGVRTDVVDCLKLSFCLSEVDASCFDMDFISLASLCDDEKNYDDVWEGRRFVNLDAAGMKLEARGLPKFTEVIL